MQSIAQEAQRVSLLFRYGVLNSAEVIAWADGMIAQMESPPDMLIELSIVAPEKTEDIIHCLGQLASRSDFWAAFRRAIPQFRDFIISHPENAEAIAHHFYLAAWETSTSDVPADFRFIFRFDDAFSLARDGICGDTKAVFHNFIRELEKFR